MPNVGTYRGVTIYYQEDRDRYRMWYTDNKGKSLFMERQKNL